VHGLPELVGGPLGDDGDRQLRRRPAPPASQPETAKTARVSKRIGAWAAIGWKAELGHDRQAAGARQATRASGRNRLRCSASFGDDGLMDAPAGSATAFGPFSAVRRRILRFLPPALLILLPAVTGALRRGPELTMWGSDMVLALSTSAGWWAVCCARAGFPSGIPHTMCGFPLLAAMQAGNLLPPTWLAAFLSPGPFWTTTVLLHLILAACSRLAGCGRVSRWAPWRDGGGFSLHAVGVLPVRVLGGTSARSAPIPGSRPVLWRMERFLQRPSLSGWILLAARWRCSSFRGFPSSPISWRFSCWSG